MGKPRLICALVCLLLFLCGQVILMITKVEATSKVRGKQHDDPMLKTDSHHDMLASVVGRYELPGVVRVIPNSLHRLQTTRSWDFLGLSAHSPVNTLHNSSMGDGVIIGVLDTGIWPEAKAFSDKGLGPIPSHWKGVCESGKRFKAKSHCNKKIIGARWFVEGFLAEYGQPLNTSGNSMDCWNKTVVFKPDEETEFAFHGDGLSSPSSILSAITRRMVRKGMQGFLAYVHDVTMEEVRRPLIKELHGLLDERVSFEICESGALVAHFQAKSDLVDRIKVAQMKDERLCKIRDELELERAPGFVIHEDGVLRFGSRFVCQFLSVDNSMVAGKVVLCFTSMNPGAVRSASEVVKEAGGVGLIVAKNPSEALYPCTDGFPCVEVDYEIGTRILFYIRSTRSPVVKLSPSKTIVGKPVLAKVAHFSSRGPNSIAPAILKVSLTVFNLRNLDAAWINNPSGFPIFAEGSPQKLADPFDYGGGIANPNGAAHPGLVYDMGTDDYVNYLCALDYNNTAISRLTGKPTVCPTEGPSILNINLPSITIPNLRNSVILTRTVTNVGASNSIYRVVIEVPFCCSVSVEPHVLVFNRTTKKITFSVTVSTTYEVNTGYFFGSITWLDGVHTVRSPLSVRTEISQPYIDDK
ncbi:hypothetical protein POTOM_006890 [Populus tomentosa]|uniref:Subtilisin-like protease fibronectin type-III domain-containing protein n=1 Tax=Populus tomentosa TaxID=118781 RepID=A0A8X8ANZ9_POPTO|nr:hypothetical protein POTOM_006890 [Populus tomentosa]